MLYLRRVGLTLFFLGVLLLVLLIDFRRKPLIEKLLLGFYNYETTSEKKREFFNYMRPIIQAENRRILKQRKRLLYLWQKKQRGEKLSDWDEKWIEQFTKIYKVKREGKMQTEIWNLLSERIDTIPETLALAQSAIESGWGASRFAKEGNSLFGQWAYSKSDPGLTPRLRAPGEKHRVAAFDSVASSVRSYMLNLNTHQAYEPFRQMRFEFRSNDALPDGYQLAIGLLRYSQRRDDYVREVRKIIRTNEHLMGLE